MKKNKVDKLNFKYIAHYLNNKIEVKLRDIVIDNYTAFTEHFVEIESVVLADYIATFTVKFGMMCDDGWLPNKTVVFDVPIDKINNSEFIQGVFYTSLVVNNC